MFVFVVYIMIVLFYNLLNVFGYWTLNIYYYYSYYHYYYYCYYNCYYYYYYYHYGYYMTLIHQNNLGTELFFILDLKMFKLEMRRIRSSNLFHSVGAAKLKIIQTIYSLCMVGLLTINHH